MAYQTDNADNYLHLYDIFIEFALDNGWVMMQDNRVVQSGDTHGSGQVFLKGTGTSGTDAIHIQLTTYRNDITDSFGWNFTGATGYQSGLAWGSQPGVLVNNYPGVALWNQPIKYWMCANGRRLMMVAKVSSVYVMCYLGYILPYATPNQYPYPLVIGGTHTWGTRRWSETGNGATIPVIPWDNGSSTVLWIRQPSGVWFQPAMNPAFSSGSTYRMTGTWPYWEISESYNGVFSMSPTLSGEYTLQPIIIGVNQLISGNVTTNALGEFEGVYHVAGRNNAAENIITIGSQEYLVIQNVYRTDLISYAAIKLA